MVRTAATPEVTVGVAQDDDGIRVQVRRSFGDIVTMHAVAAEQLAGIPEGCRDLAGYTRSGRERAS